MDAPATSRFERDEDPIDIQLHRLGAAPARVRALPWHVRLGITWSSGAAPVVLLLFVGLAMGPKALAILTPGVLSAIDPAMPVALAVLGAHVGLNLARPRSSIDRRLFLVGHLESLITGAIVAGGVLFLLSPDLGAPPFHAWLVALTTGVCAATSAARPEGETAALTPARQAENYDVLLPIVLGGAVLAWIREGNLEAAALLLQAIGLAIVIAAAAWLLLTRTTSETEQRIFGVSSLLIVGGLADYLSLSALLSGLVAGAFWGMAAGPAAESIRRDVGYLQHPLIVLLLVVAAARMGPLSEAWSLAAGYVLLRTLGKLFGAWAARRMTRAPVPQTLGLLLLSPGVYGIAFAMNTVRSAGPQSDPLLAIVVLGTIGSQLLAAARRPEEIAG